jgi:hypothetical protein
MLGVLYCSLLGSEELGASNFRIEYTSTLRTEAAISSETLVMAD